MVVLCVCVCVRVVEGGGGVGEVGGYCNNCFKNVENFLFYGKYGEVKKRLFKLRFITDLIFQ